MLIGKIFRQAAAVPGVLYRDWNVADKFERKFNRNMIVAMGFGLLYPIGVIMTLVLAAVDKCPLETTGGIMPIISANCPVVPASHHAVAQPIKYQP